MRLRLHSLAWTKDECVLAKRRTQSVAGPGAGVVAARQGLSAGLLAAEGRCCAAGQLPAAVLTQASERHGLLAGRARSTPLRLLDYSCCHLHAAQG